MGLTVNDFTIEPLENRNFVVKAPGRYQDIDFVNGGFIATQTRAEEIRDLLIEQSNQPIVTPISNEEKINSLAEQNAQILLALVQGGLM